MRFRRGGRIYRGLGDWSGVGSDFGLSGLMKFHLDMITVLSRGYLPMDSASWIESKTDDVLPGAGLNDDFFYVGVLEVQSPVFIDSGNIPDV